MLCLESSLSSISNFIDLVLGKQLFTDSVSVNKKYLTDSVFPIEKKHVKGGGLLYGGLLDPSLHLILDQLPPLHCQCGHNLRLRSEPLEAEA